MGVTDIILFFLHRVDVGDVDVSEVYDSTSTRCSNPRMGLISIINGRGSLKSLIILFVYVDRSFTLATCCMTIRQIEATHHSIPNTTADLHSFLIQACKICLRGSCRSLLNLHIIDFGFVC
jgi:hypothetical protein